MDEITRVGAGVALPMKPLPIKLPEELHKKAKDKSKRTGVPIAFIVRKALEEWVSGKGETTDQEEKPKRKSK